jgi:hypothetical protein
VGKDSRKSQLFMAYGHHTEALGTQSWETPIGTVVQGLSHMDQFVSYGETTPRGTNGPDVVKMEQEGRKYVDETFPHMDYFLRCHVERFLPKGVASSETVEMELMSVLKMVRAIVNAQIFVCIAQMVYYIHLNAMNHCSQSFAGYHISIWHLLSCMDDCKTRFNEKRKESVELE